MYEDEGTVKCQVCGEENPSNRVTCKACHIPLLKDKSEDAPKETPAVQKKAKPKTEKTQPAPKTQPAQETKTNVNPFDDKKKASAPPVAKIVKKRRTRRKSKAPTNEQYFVLQGNILTPVEISLRVKALKKKQAKTEAKMVIDLWNRNKDLISK